MPAIFKYIFLEDELKGIFDSRQITKFHFKQNNPECKGREHRVRVTLYFLN